MEEGLYYNVKSLNWEVFEELFVFSDFQENAEGRIQTNVTDVLRILSAKKGKSNRRGSSPCSNEELV